MKRRPQYYSQISDRIDNLAEGSVFTASDFFDIADSGSVNRVLSRMQEDGKIRRVLQGVYDKPEYSVFLGEYSVPRIDFIAEALARKFNWTIAPQGDTALNMMHLSTQVPNNWCYISDGPYREYCVGNTKLSFKHCSNKEISGRSTDTIMLIQALKALGKDNIKDIDIVQMRRVIDAEKRGQILSESRTSTAWIYQNIKRICGGI